MPLNFFHILFRRKNLELKHRMYLLSLNQQSQNTEENGLDKKNMDLYLCHLASLCTEISLAACVAVINCTSNYKFITN